MRAYSIVVTDPVTKAVIRPTSLSVNPAPTALSFLDGPAPILQGTWSSFINGRQIPGALNIECDIPVSEYAQPMGQSWLRIWGISLGDIFNAAALTSKNISVFAGMQAGLPLANPKQYGLIATGKINQAFGNWQGTDQTLDLFFYPDTGIAANPKNIVLHWLRGTPLSQALQSTLATAFPNYKVTINIKNNIVQDRYDGGPFMSLNALAQWCKIRSKAIIGGTNYQGVGISVLGTQINVFDYGDPPSKKTPRMIAFQDLIGQPTWIDPATISFKVVMRADLAIGDYISLPPTVAVATLGSLIGTPQRSSFAVQGTFQIAIVRHLGNYRQSDGDSWVTAVDAYPVAVPS